MSARKVTISHEAARDLQRLHADGLLRYSKRRADTYLADLVSHFDLIASFPLSCRERLEFDPPLRFAVYQSHLIAYRFEDETILIVRVLHAHTELKSLFT